MAYLRVYEREIISRRTYPSALAQSVHFALSFDGKNYTPLKNNYGILYPKAEIGELDNILERGAKTPKIIFEDTLFYIFAEYVDASGHIVYPDKIVLWTTKDFVSFKEHDLVDRYKYKKLIENASDTAPIPDNLVENIISAYSNIHFTHAEIPSEITISDVRELDSVDAVCYYSDGSTDKKSVIWNTKNINGKGTYEISGEIFQLEYPAPCAEGYADPIVFSWEGKKYFTATNVMTDCVGLYVSSADSVMGLFTNDNKPVCILPYDEKRNICTTFWAPEFHVIGGKLSILFAVGGKGEFLPQSHIIQLKPGGDILDPESWSDPVRIKRPNGEYLVTGKGHITLDMTYFEVNGHHYYVWSQRYFQPVDSGSMLFIGEFDPKDPTILISEPVLISRPLYGWENQSGTVNNEGPHPIFIKDEIFLAYSSASAGSFSYSVAYLIAKLDSDLLDPDSWKKTHIPYLTAYDMSDCVGPGHNGFCIGDDGKLIITHHAQDPANDHHRLTYLRRVHMDKNGFPRIDLIPERDLPKDKRSVSVRVNII